MLAQLLKHSMSSLVSKALPIATEMFDAVFFPKETICVYCGEEYGYCDCLDSIKLIEPNPCTVCGRQRTDRELYGRCRECDARPPYYDVHRSYAYYDGAVKRGLMDLKYHNALYHVRTFGGMLYEKYLDERRVFCDIDVVTYIPISKVRRMERGYNQAEELAREFARLSGVPCVELLRRSKQTKKLKTLGRDDRREELRDSMEYVALSGKRAARFSANGCNGASDEMPGITFHKVLLIDDIFTTGATLNEAARVLKRAGIGKVCALTVAEGK